MQYTIVIANYNGKHLLDTCLSSLVPQVDDQSSIIVVDNGSADGSVEYIERSWPGVTILSLGSNTGFTGANNAGAAQSDSEVVVLLNNDTKVASGWLENLLATLDDLSVGAVTSSMRRMGDSKTMDSAGGEIDTLGYSHDRGRGEPCSEWEVADEILFPCGGAMAVRRRALEDRHSIFWDRLFLYNEDTDLGLRLWENGFKVVYQPGAIVEHAFSATAGENSPVKTWYCARNRILVLKRHLGREFYRIRPLLAFWEINVLSYLLLTGKTERFRMSLAGAREGFSSEVRSLGKEREAKELFSRFMKPTVGTRMRRKVGRAVSSRISDLS